MGSAVSMPPPLVMHMKQLFIKYDTNGSGELEWGEV